MPIAIAAKREFEYTANDENGDPCLFPRHPVSSTFVQAFNFTTKNINIDPARYLAFPFLVKLGSTLVGLHSNSDSHASGTSQLWIKSSDNGATWTTGTAFDNNTSTFDPSFLTGLLAVGESVVLKIWTIKNVAGTLTVFTNSTVFFSGDTYALWSRAVPGPSSKLYRTGYTTVAGDSKTALFESSDGGETWTGVSVIFSTGGRQYNEADLVNTTGSNWLAVVREETAATNILYYASSVDDGATWSAPLAYTQTLVNGRQPNLTKMTDGSIILATGDRSGGSGYAPSGDQVAGFDTTGITVFRTAVNTLGSNPITAVSIGSNAVRVTQVGHGYTNGQLVQVAGSTDVGGIPAAEINRIHSITVISANVYEFNTVSNATSATTGGGASVTSQNLTLWSFRTRISPTFSTDGGQPMLVETTSNRALAVFYTRRTVKQNPIIASASFDVAPL